MVLLFRINLLPEYKNLWAVRASCNPSFSTDNEEIKVLYLVLERSTSKPVYSYCTCTVGYVIIKKIISFAEPINCVLISRYFFRLRGDCSHVGALMFMLCDIVAEGKIHLPPDLTCTDLPCSWSNPKGDYSFYLFDNNFLVQ